MSASSLRYRPTMDRNMALREDILALPPLSPVRLWMIYLKPRQRGDIVNHKRVERLHAGEA